jgi:hypothetical protein
MKKLKKIKDIIYNNPRADKQNNDDEDNKIEKETKNSMLYDDFMKKCRNACRPNINKQKNV